MTYSHVHAVFAFEFSQLQLQLLDLFERKFCCDSGLSTVDGIVGGPLAQITTKQLLIGPGLTPILAPVLAMINCVTL
jgi:hypothetical protein